MPSCSPASGPEANPGQDMARISQGSVSSEDPSNAFAPSIEAVALQRFRRRVFCFFTADFVLLVI